FHIYNNGNIRGKSLYVIKKLAAGAGVVVCCVILRSVIQALLIAVFDINTPDSEVGLHSLADMLALFNGSEGLQELFMLIKRFWLVYHVNAIVYLPVTGYELACWVFGICSIYYAVRKKSLWYPLLFTGMLLTPFLLTFIEAKVTFYRSCQYMPFYTAIGMTLLYEGFRGGKYKRLWNIAVSLLAFIFIYNQTTQLNNNFYMDYRQYELTKETLLNVAYDVESEYGNDIPVVFIGEYNIPYEFVQDFYVSYDSWQYKLISKITDTVDVHLKEKYWQPEGYCFIGEANLPMIRWAFDAFDGTNREMISFLKMHGHSFTTLSDSDEYTELRSTLEGQGMPGYPEEGSIIIYNGYVVVNFKS
ncbi:MAG: glucosyltransferase domain-containing protein, partial [Lachnospiraceae bacterium]|nr:glucosyltransferase domain-containing protein [Lachnospiraceae bacterium]